MAGCRRAHVTCVTHRAIRSLPACDDSLVLHVILFEPEIPPNAGNVIRLCANTGSTLHLVRPLGFAIDDARVKRAGLDYHEMARVRQHESLEACLGELERRRVFAVETGVGTRYDEVRFAAGDAFLFGRETTGLPGEILAGWPHGQRLRLPMIPGNRSLNLSNAVAVVVFEAWRQLGFAGS
jgi:tRNA (cytidine/uridine-2'-O-)-methyltransferase